MDERSKQKFHIYPPKPQHKPALRRVSDHEYEVMNYDAYRERDVRNLFELGVPSFKPTNPRREARQGRPERRKKAEAWLRTPGPGATLYMDSAEAIRRANISRWRIGRYDAIQKLLDNRHLIPDGTYSFQDLAKGPLAGKLAYVGNSDPDSMHDNDTAEKGTTNFASPFRRDNRIAETLGSMRTFFADSSSVTKRNGYIYLKIDEKLNKDNWDTASSSIPAKVYNALRPGKGKQVILKYTGPGYTREFYIPLKTGKIEEINAENQQLYPFLNDLR